MWLEMIFEGLEKGQLEGVGEKMLLGEEGVLGYWEVMRGGEDYGAGGGGWK